MIVKGLIVPGKPHPLLVSDKNEGWKKLNQAFDKARKEIEATQADVLLIYSTQWLSVIGHQIQADPEPRWNHVDQEWHQLGTIPYQFKMDSSYAEEYQSCAQKRGLHARTVSYQGFPIDTGTVVALKLLNPQNKLPACVVSCNMYADRAETLVLGKAARDALEKQNKKAVAVAVTSLSHRLFTKDIPYAEDRIYSQKDDEWNRKILELLSHGRLEDVSQLAREFSQQASGDQKMKALWWLASLMGQHNRYDGIVHEYQPIWGSGAAVVSLTPSSKKEFEREFDEEDVEFFGSAQSKDLATPQSSTSKAAISVANAPKPVGAYPHARRVGEMLYLSGIGPRNSKDNSIPGGPVRNEKGQAQNYDVAAQTRAVIENVKTILEGSGSSLEKVVDIQVFLVDMDRDFKNFNAVYAEYFKDIQATRTTVSISALPTPIAVEFKVMALA